LKGIKFANTFLKHIVGEETTRKIVELSAKRQDEDEFTEVHGLV